MKTDKRAALLKEAWIGDAVLALYARRWILAQTGVLDGERAARLTSNQFLGSLFQADEVEAHIGRLYETQGLAAAFAWIEAELIPLFERQEANRRKRSPVARVR